MSQWQELYKRYQQLDQERAERARETEQRARREAEVVQHKQAYDAWCVRAAQEVVQAVASAAEARAKEFATATGRTIRVDVPHDGHVGTTDHGPAMTFLRLTLDDVAVLLYTYRAAGTPPSVHFVHAEGARAGGDLHPTLISSPGAMVLPESGGGYSLRRLPSVGGTDDHGAPTTVDALVFRAFELLVEACGRTPSTVNGTTAA